MDIEFHYYMTYLIATRAGFVPADAEIIAHSAQSVDDNHIRYVISGDPAGPYSNYISQTMNILRPAKVLYRIYPIFHFIPGVFDAPSASRADDRTDPWVTTPDSPVARKMIDSALASKDLYRIGVSAHGYVDTWAHQNFLGRRDSFNDIAGDGYVNIDNLLNIGHGAAEHKPDKPALIWTDPRLVASQVNNRERFLDAAEALYRRFARYIDPVRSEDSITNEAAILRADLDQDIGPPDPYSDDSMTDARVDRYCRRAAIQIYGGTALSGYDQFAWLNAAVAEEEAVLRQRISAALDIADDYVDQTNAVSCTWKDSAAYKSTDLYYFFEAVKAHQNACWTILTNERLPGLDDPNL